MSTRQKNLIIRLGIVLGVIMLCYGVFFLKGMRSFKSSTYDSEIEDYSSSEIIRVTKQYLLPYRNELDLPTPNRFKIFIGYDRSVFAFSLYHDLHISRIILPEWRPKMELKADDFRLALLDEVPGGISKPSWWFSSKGNIGMVNYYEEHIKDTAKEKGYWIHIVCDVANSKIFVWVSSSHITL